MMKYIKKNPLIKILDSSLWNLPTPSNISTMWNFGSLLGMCLIIQITTGIFLAMHYCPNIELAFTSVAHICRDVNYGWLIRTLHANGASVFFICLYAHIGRGMYYSSYYMIETWMIGVTIFFLVMATAFLGYVLPWGQMSFWGATVITNLVSAIPYLGNTIVQWVWGGFAVDNATLTRLFAFHFLFPFIKITQPTELSHLRFISILPTFSKILEKVLDHQIRSFLDAFNILPPKQSGFRAGFGCDTAMSAVVDDIIESCDQGSVSALMILDYTKAFDMLNHSILLSMLHYFGFGEGAISLIKSFLSDSTQKVQVKNSVSDSLSVSTGVPQGSMLGPLLYTIYTSTFHECLNFCNYHLYADDTQLYCSFDVSDLNTVNLNINLDLQNMMEISNDHQLKINPTKSSIILFGSENLSNRAENALNVQVNNVTVPFSTVSKSLGLLVDSELRFRDHIKSKISKAYCTLKLIYNHSYYLTSEIKKLLCDALVLSHFNHCDVVYGHCIDSMYVRKMQKVQNSCLRFIYGVSRRHRVSHLLRDAGWLNMHNSRKLHFAAFCHKILKTKTPSYLFNKIVFRTDIHNRNMRSNLFINIPSHRKEIYKSSFTYNLANYVNFMNTHEMNLSTSSFKNMYKTRLLLSQ